MQHLFTCPNCRKTIAVTDEMLEIEDSVIDCAYCHVDMTVPQIHELLRQLPSQRFSSTHKPSFQKQIRLPGGKKVPIVLRLAKTEGTSGAGNIPSSAQPLTPVSEPAPTRSKKTVPISEYWFAAEGDEVFGPVTRAELTRLAIIGKLTRQSLVWTTLAPAPVKATEVPSLVSLLKDSAPVAPTYSEEIVDIGDDKDAVMCPYCWHRFLPGDVLFISNHPDLLGDPVLGEGEQQRFLPTRFNASGHAIDSGGIVCPDMACPLCHLRLPSPVLDTHPTFLSIVGSPGSGKSYFLASAVWKLRTALPHAFGARFMDVDAQTNQWINDYEAKLFFQSDPAARQSIAKTDEQAGNVYRQVKINGLPTFLPLPCLFSLAPASSSDRSPKDGLRTLILYDNAGEHFQAGHDSAHAPGTKHLLHAEGIVFLYDPTEDPRFRPHFKPGVAVHRRGAAAQRQDVLLVEMLNRIRKHHNLPSADRFPKPLIVALSKADLLDGFPELAQLPWSVPAPQQPAALDVGAIARLSFKVRSLLCDCAPEVVTLVESFADQVVFMPFSALGHQPQPEGIRPCDVSPQWSEVPFLYLLSKLGLVPSFSKTPGFEPAPNLASPAADAHSISGVNPHTGEPLVIPLCYSGHTIRCTRTGEPIRLPVVEGATAI